MKSLSLIIMLVFVTACGKSGGDGSQGSHTEPLKIDCHSKVNRDSLIDYAVSANSARSECNLTEDQAVRFVQ